MSGFNEDSIRSIIDDVLLNTYVSIPAKVTDYDVTKQKVSVLPLISKKEPYQDTEREIPEIHEVPVQFAASAGGSAFITFPIKKGDLGLVLFMDSDLVNYLESDGSKQVESSTFANHNLNDAVFIPGVQPWPKALKNVSADNIQIHNGTTDLQLTPDGKINFSNTGGDLIGKIIELIEILEAVTVATSVGSQPFMPPAIANLGLLKTWFNTMKP